MNILEQFWTILDILGQSWTIFGHFWTIFDTMWINLVRDFRKKWVMFDGFGWCFNVFYGFLMIFIYFYDFLWCFLFLNNLMEFSVVFAAILLMPERARNQLRRVEATLFRMFWRRYFPTTMSWLRRPGNFKKFRDYIIMVYIGILWYIMFFLTLWGYVLPLVCSHRQVKIPRGKLSTWWWTCPRHIFFWAQMFWDVLRCFFSDGMFLIDYFGMLWN